MPTLLENFLGPLSIFLFQFYFGHLFITFRQLFISQKKKLKKYFNPPLVIECRLPPPYTL